MATPSSAHLLASHLLSLVKIDLCWNDVNAGLVVSRFPQKICMISQQNFLKVEISGPMLTKHLDVRVLRPVRNSGNMNSTLAPRCLMNSDPVDCCILYGGGRLTLVFMFWENSRMVSTRVHASGCSFKWVRTSWAILCWNRKMC